MDWHLTSRVDDDDDYPARLGSRDSDCPPRPEPSRLPCLPGAACIASCFVEKIIKSLAALPLMNFVNLQTLPMSHGRAPRSHFGSYGWLSATRKLWPKVATTTEWPRSELRTPSQFLPAR